jgi:signal transduction histidine kinase
MSALPVIDSLSVASALFVMLVASYVIRHRESPVAEAFAWSVVSLSLWAVLVLLPGRFFIPPGSSIPGWALVELVRFFISLTAPVLFYIYARLYTGHNQYSNRRKIAILLAPLAGAFAVVAPVALVRHLLPAPVFAIVSAISVSLMIYVAVLLLLALYLLFALSQRYRELPTAQAVVLAVAISAPYVVVFVNSLSEPTEGGETVSILPVDVSFVGFLITGVAVTYATRSYPLFRPLPGAEYIAREEVIENLADGILILDREERIVDMNATASRIAQHAVESPLGRPVGAVFDGFSRLSPDGVRRIELRTPDGPRQFEVTASPIQTGEDGSTGKTVRLRDITERETREQQLEVLTRVLRHNLRNDLDTVMAYTNEIADPEIKSQLRSTAEGLLDMGDKARDVEAVLAKANEPRSEVAFVDLLHTVADRVQAEHEGAIIDCTHPETVSILSHRQLLERLLTELLENGIEHNDSQSPQVAITVETLAEDTVEIEIADNGSGIPPHERQVIEAGSESQLSHGTGLGLWLANWIVGSLSGELSFPENRSGGVVVVRLHSVQLPPSVES